jgi:hypothetical protein
MQSKSTTHIEQRTEEDNHLEACDEGEHLEFPTPVSPAEGVWDNTAEQAWSEHSTTAWALAYVIHRIRSTPLPPILPPEQRRHFHKVVQMAAALMEEWQRRERDQAQQLAAGRPVSGEADEQPPKEANQLPGSAQEER